MSYEKDKRFIDIVGLCAIAIPIIAVIILIVAW